jgi:farnesyl-diphosphate farnesyltransferase
MPTLAEVLRATSRTFAIGIEGLPHSLQEEMRLAYLILRVSDYLEDNTTLPPAEKATLLDFWAETLEGGEPPPALLEHLTATDDPSPDSMAAHHAEGILKGLRALEAGPQAVISKHTRDSTLGMARWVRRGPVFETETDLDDYMHEVAGRVGYLITGLFSLASPRVRSMEREMMSLGREFGLALQTVNVVRGIPSDVERGWFFIPREFLPDTIRSGESFLAEENRELAVSVVDRLLDKAATHFEAAEEYIRLLPRVRGRLRFFCLLPYFFGVRTLALSQGNPDVLLSEVKLSRTEVRSIAKRSAILGWSNAWISRYARSMTEAP